MTSFKIPSEHPFVIAELANSHEGSAEKLTHLIERTIEAKPDAIKFQLFKADDLLVPNHPNYELFKKLEIPDYHWRKIFGKLKSGKVKVFADVFSIERARFANKLGVDAFKVHSSDMSNSELLEFVGNTGKPILLSCAGCSLNEIDNAVSIIRKTNSQLVLMHGYQAAPTQIHEINLRRIGNLRKRYNVQVGYMDHIDGSSELALYMPLLAIGMGANVIEKHITLSRDSKEEDYESALNPDEFSKMVKMLRNLFLALGAGKFDIVEQELRYRNIMKKRPVAKRDLPSKSVLKRSDIALKRIPFKVSDFSIDAFIGAATKTRVRRNTPLTENNVILRNVRVVAAIACRVESTRLFGKPLQTINKITILDNIIYQLEQSKKIDEIVLAISEKAGNEIFIEFARRNNLKFVTGSDIDVLKRILAAAEHVNANIVFRITSEDPFIYWEIIDSAIEHHIKSKSDFTYTPNLPDGVGFEIINVNALKKSHERGNNRYRSELVTEYIYRHKSQFRISPFGIQRNLRRPEIRLTVDYPEDLILVRSIMSKIPRNKKPAHLRDIIDVLDKNSELKKINERYVDRGYRSWL